LLLSFFYYHEISCEVKTLKSATFALVGASRTGIALAYHLDKVGFEPVFLWNRSQVGLDRSAKYLKFHSLSIELSRIPQDIDWIIIGVKDDAIRDIAEQLCGIQANDLSANVIHISGAWDAGLLGCLQQNGYRTGSFHPLISVPDIDTGIREMSGAVFSCEGELGTELVSLAAKIGASGIRVSAEQKVFIHLAAVFVNNYQSALIQALKRIGSTLGIHSQNLEKLLSGLSRQAACQAWSKSLAGSLTGPAVRGDKSTIHRHLQQLADYPQLQALYRQYLQVIQDLMETEKQK
jgi:predicted short-subunit dehydrogenase-like oxidoreductase (DUF2520 family)